MSGRKRGSFAAEWSKLEAQVARGKPQPKVPPLGLPLSQIRMRPNVFQHRDPNEHEGQAHVRKLAEALNRSPTAALEPMTVWWDGKGWTAIDGHHRHAAYKVVGAGGDRTVPVMTFEGSLVGALAEAAAANSKNKRIMSTAEKTQAAWRIVVMEQGLSKAEIADAAGVSPGTVATMRRIHVQLCAEAEARSDDLDASMIVEHRDLRWAEARRLAEGREAPDVDWEAKDETAAIAMAVAIRKAIGNRGSQKLHVLARALELYDSRLEDTLMDYWSAKVDEDDDASGPQ